MKTIVTIVHSSLSAAVVKTVYSNSTSNIMNSK